MTHRLRSIGDHPTGDRAQARRYALQFLLEGISPVSSSRGDYIIGVYVDDLVHVYSDDTEYDALVAKFKAEFNQYDDLGPLTEIFNGGTCRENEK